MKKIRYFSMLLLTAFAATFLCSCSSVILQGNESSGQGIYYSQKETIHFSGVTVNSSSINPIPDYTESRPSESSTKPTSVLSCSKPDDTTSVSEIETTTTSGSSEPVGTSASSQQTTVSVTASSFSTSTTPKPIAAPSADDLPVNNYNAVNYSETKGVWISYFELYPVLTNKSADSLRKGIGEYYDKIKSLGLNTVYVHVRPYGDAIYRSDYYPWSKYCTGYIGEDPGYDPLPVMIDEAHKRGLSFQAWINPLRCYIDEDISDISDKYVTKQWYNNDAGRRIVKVDNYWYLDPAYDEVIDLIYAGVSEIVSKYDVDGVHIDDYFYPTTAQWFDSEAFYSSSYNDLQQFRLDNCSKMVTAMYDAVKNHNSTAIFGVSTQGNVANNYAYMYADVKKWCSEKGYVDYMAPQIYYGFNNAAQPFSQVVDEWDEMLKGTGKKLIPGLAVYKIGTEDEWAGSGKYEWINDKKIISRQIEKSKSAQCYGGVVLYSYKFIFEPETQVSDAVNSEIKAVKEMLG